MSQAFISCKLALKLKEPFSPENLPYCTSLLIFLFFKVQSSPKVYMSVRGSLIY